MKKKELYGTTIYFYYEDRKKDGSNSETYYAGMNSFYNHKPIKFLMIANDITKKAVILNLKTMKLKEFKK